MMVLYYFRRYLEEDLSFEDSRMAGPHHFVTAYFDALGEVMVRLSETAVEDEQTWPPQQSYSTVQVAKPIFTTRYILDTKAALSTQDLFYDVDTRSISEFPRKKRVAYLEPDTLNWVFPVTEDGPQAIVMREHEEQDRPGKKSGGKLRARIEAILPEFIRPRLQNARPAAKERLTFPLHVRRIG
jgi:hypothetical protein